MEFSLRDHFAGLAMQGLLIATVKEEPPAETAAKAYAMADAMVVERELAERKAIIERGERARANSLSNAALQRELARLPPSHDRAETERKRLEQQQKEAQLAREEAEGRARVAAGGDDEFVTRG